VAEAYIGPKCRGSGGFGFLTADCDDDAPGKAQA
jgi:hypothetical protein